MAKKLYQSIATALVAWKNCLNMDVRSDWEDKWDDAIDNYVNQLPHGSGIDGTTVFDRDRSNDSRLIFSIDYHCMNENGFYDGWITYTIVVKPSLSFGMTVTVKGRDYNGSKDYLADVFDAAFDQDYE